MFQTKFVEKIKTQCTYNNFYCCTVQFDNTDILITNNCTPLLHI